MAITLKQKPEYPKHFKEKAFYKWYANGCPRGPNALVDCFEEFNGHKPSYEMIKHWMVKEGWPARKDELDAEASTKMDRIVIDDRIKMFQEHEKQAGQMRNAAFKYIEQHEPESVATAIKMYVEMAQIERSARGYAAALAQISKLSDEKLDKEIRKLLGNGNTEDEELPSDDVIDADIEST